MRTNRFGGWAGSALLVVLGSLAVLRPDLGSLLAHNRGEPSRSATAPVIRVIDGDTFEARIGGHDEDVRLIGVDTPETVKPDTPVQCFGPPASHFTHRLLEGKTVHLVFGVEQRDIYGRLLAYVHLGRRFVNALLVRRGYARTLTIPPNDRFAPLLRRLEMGAARSGRGLWGRC